MPDNDTPKRRKTLYEIEHDQIMARQFKWKSTRTALLKEAWRKSMQRLREEHERRRKQR